MRGKPSHNVVTPASGILCGSLEAYGAERIYTFVYVVVVAHSFKKLFELDDHCHNAVAQLLAKADPEPVRGGLGGAGVPVCILQMGFRGGTVVVFPGVRVGVREPLEGEDTRDAPSVSEDEDIRFKEDEVETSDDNDRKEEGCEDDEDDGVAEGAESGVGVNPMPAAMKSPTAPDELESITIVVLAGVVLNGDPEGLVPEPKAGAASASKFQKKERMAGKKKRKRGRRQGSKRTRPTANL